MSYIQVRKRGQVRNRVRDCSGYVIISKISAYNEKGMVKITISSVE